MPDCRLRTIAGNRNGAGKPCRHARSRDRLRIPWQREKTLDLLKNAPVPLLQELTHQPDVRELQQDSRFQKWSKMKKRGNTMSDHTVTLNYSANGFTADPPKIKVKLGQTIQFKLGAGPANGTVRVTFKDPQFFSAKLFHSGDSDMRVTGKPSPTSYRCELLVAGDVVAHSAENARR